MKRELEKIFQTIINTKKKLQCITKIPLNNMKKLVLGVILILKCNYRVKECMTKGITDIDPNIDGGSWLSLKEHALRGNIIAQLPTKPPDFPTQWNRFSGQEIPKFYSYGRIYQNLIEAFVLEEHKNFREATISAYKLNVKNSDYSTAKPLRRGRMYFESGHVTDMQDSKTVDRGKSLLCAFTGISILQKRPI